MYLEDLGKISVIPERVEAIESLIPEHFHLPLSMDKESYIHIYTFNIVVKMPRAPTDNIPTFLQCGQHTKFGTIFGLSLPDLSVNCSDFCNRVPYFLYFKLTGLGEEYLASRFLTVDAISKVTQYDLYTENLTVTPKNVILTSNEEYLTCIVGLEKISNPFKKVYISEKINIREIGSVASRQANKKGKKYAMSHHPKFSQPDASSTP